MSILESIPVEIIRQKVHQLLFAKTNLQLNKLYYYILTSIPALVVSVNYNKIITSKEVKKHYSQHFCRLYNLKCHSVHF